MPTIAVATALLDVIRAAGVQVELTRLDDVDRWEVEALDTDGQLYRVTGPDAYTVLVELAEQAGFDRRG